MNSSENVVTDQKTTSSTSPNTTQPTTTTSITNSSSQRANESFRKMKERLSLTSDEMVGDCVDEEEEEYSLQSMEQNINSLHTIIDKLTTIFKPLFNETSNQTNTSLTITKIEPQFGPLQKQTQVTINFSIPFVVQQTNTTTNNKTNVIPLDRYKVIFGKFIIEPQNIQSNTLQFLTPSIDNNQNSYEIKVLDLESYQFISSNPAISFTFLTDPKEEALTDLNRVKDLFNQKKNELLHEKTYSNGQTALHVAFKLAQFEIVKYLVLQSDEFDCLVQQDDNGHTPFDVAMNNKHYLFLTKIIDWLKQVVKNKLQFQQNQFLNMPSNNINSGASPISVPSLNLSNNSTPLTSSQSFISSNSNTLASPIGGSYSARDLNSVTSATSSARSSLDRHRGSFDKRRSRDLTITTSLTPKKINSPTSNFDSSVSENFGTPNNHQTSDATPNSAPHISSSVPTQSPLTNFRTTTDISDDIVTNGINSRKSNHKRVLTNLGSQKNQSTPVMLDDESTEDDSDSAAIYSAVTPVKLQATVEEREEEAISNLIVKYRLDQYSDIYKEMLDRNDPLVHKITRKIEMRDDWDNSFKKRKETMLVPLTREKSYLEEVQLERRANPFKPSIYYDEEVDDGYTEGTLLLSQFHEDSSKLLPYNVLSTIQTMSSDFIIVSFKSLDTKVRDVVFNVDDLKQVSYEIDILDRKKIDDKRKKAQKSNESPTAADELDVSLVLPGKQKLLAIEGLQEPEFLLATFEDVFPCEDQQKVTNDDTKLLYSDFEWEPSHIDPTSQYLFELKGFELDVNKKLDIPLEEAYFVTVSLYTYTDKAFKKISEDVEFKIETHPKEEDTITKLKAMFSVQKNFESKVVALFKFFRRFKGELTETLNDLYTQKAEKVKQGDVKKYFTKNEKLCTFPGVASSISIFGWSAIHLQDCLKRSEVVLSDSLYILPRKCRTGDAILLDSYLDVYTNAVERESKPLMKKTIYGKLSFIFKELPNIPPIPRHYHPNSHELVIKLDSKHLRVQQIPNLENSLLTKILPLSSELIIYPKELNLTKKDFKNITVKVSFLNEQKKPMNVFYPKFSRNPERNSRVPYRFTSVSVGNRQPEFCDELKCILPCRITNYSLQFEFLNVLHKENLILKNHREDVQRIGYAIVHLAEAALNGTEMKLEIYTEKKEANVVKTEKVDGYFTFQLYSRSIAFPTDNNLMSFFDTLDLFQKRNYFKKMSRKRDSDDDFFLISPDLSLVLPNLKLLGVQHMAFAPVILNQLFLLYFDIGTDDEDTQHEIFVAIIDMIDKYRTEHRTIVPGWIKFQFTSVFPDYMMERLPTIAKSVKYILERDDYDSKIIKNANYLFSILLKAMVVHMDFRKNKMQNADHDFSETFYETINTITTKSFRNLLKRNISKTRPVTIINTTVIFAQFLKVLLTILDKPYVMKLIASFVELIPLITPTESEMGKNKNTILECIANLQVITYKEVFSYDNYLQLFVPESIEKILQNDSLPPLDDTHFLFSSFVDTVIKNLVNPLKETRNHTALVFREFLYKLMSTSRNSTLEEIPEASDRINLMTFEFVDKFLGILQDWRSEVEKSVNSNKKKMNECKKRKIMIQQQLAAKKESQRAASESSLAGIQLEMLNKEIIVLETNFKQFEGMINKTKEELKKDMKESFKEKRQLITCVFHILKNTEQRYIKKWLKQINITKRLQFLQMMQLILQSFEYQSEAYYKVFYEHYYNTQVKVKNKVNADLSSNNSTSTATVSANASSASSLLSNPQALQASTNISSISQSNEALSTDTLADIGTYVAGDIEEITSPKTATSELVKAGASLMKKKNKQGFFSKLIPNFVSSDQNLKTDIKELRTLSKARLLDSADKTKSVKLETNSSIYVKKCVNIEQNWSREVSNYVFELLVFCIEEIMTEKTDHHLDSASILENVVKIFLTFLRINQPEDVLINVLIYLKCFFANHYKQVFDEEANAQYPTLFCECLMMHCNSSIPEVRSHATACLYLLIRYMYIINYNTILKPQVLTTLALSKTLQKYVSPVVNITYLKSAIDAIGRYAYLDPDPPISVQQTLNNQTTQSTAATETKTLSTLDSFFRKMEQRVKLLSAIKERKEESTFAEEVNTQVCKKLQSLLHDTTSVKSTLALEDIHKTEDLFLRISQVYTRIPELRFVWLNQLAANHYKNGQYLEASQCYMTILSLVFDHLKSINSPILAGISVQSFFAISPLKRKTSADKLTSANPNNRNAMNDCFISNQAVEFTEYGIIQLLSKAVECLELAEYFESCIVLERLSLPFLERSNDWIRLSNAYHHLQDLCDRLKKPDRLEPYYYKIELVNFPPERSQPNHIYKMPKLFKLFKMNKWVQEKFGSPFVNEQMEVVSGAKKVDIDPNKRYIFLTPVKPLTKSVKPIIIGNQKISKYEGNIRKFYYESAYGKKTEVVTEAYKKKVIITCMDYFPNMKTRLQIESEEEVILTPIEAAIENIESQISKLREALQIPGDDEIDISQIKTGNNIDLANLQLVLQGSIKATVQGGPASIVEGFLKMDQRPLYAVEHIINLNRKCHVFLKLCEEAVKVENQLMDKATERAFHQEMEKGLIETQQLFAEHLTPLDEMFYSQSQNYNNYSPEDSEMNRGSVIGDIPMIRNFRFSMPQHELTQLGMNYEEESDDRDFIQ
ncbi:dedicator of cytokinesis protein-like protein [Naegleria gruberi]|uniref:Dedicator of cytokinesis protein-like protein n=1 Tax=Naegleria gruberi TaxID=5762 RepID=D2VL91_NAEGR|nr:dedicator of cytokinesis protein-like protein [Naegleria gruberi]EFC42271.1 dedicator of cytokinesis protein-like protein [Naegleria gruberi]|eukprot:XP_002675015.1 dedicator of cytokinesis protein-like protein [Naegleria gruberi strain NEG-M]